MTTLADLYQLLASAARREPWRPATGERVVIYGAGGFARVTYQAVRDAGANIVCALDRRGDAARIAPELPTFRPGEEPADGRESTTAVVGVLNREANPLEMEQLLRSLGYSRVVSVPELYESFGSELGPRFWLTSRAEYVPHEPRIAEAADIWSDDVSAELYRSILSFRLLWDTTVAPSPCVGPQYFPPDVVRFGAPLRFVDCGAFTGDTLADVARLGMAVESVFAFEPDRAHYERLVAYSKEFSRLTGAAVSLWPCAVADKVGMMSFESDAGEAGRLHVGGSSQTLAVSLDEVLPSAGPTYIKMDIEGAELRALAGATAMIRRSRPRLAICAYHRPEDLWEIPLFVRDLDLSYDLYLRAHGHDSFDVVMYAVPRA
jgi:FkbM family methyltransferase